LIGGLYDLIVGLKLSRPTSRRIIMLSDLFKYYWLEVEEAECDILLLLIIRYPIFHY